MEFYTLSHNIIILISSYPLISLINCPWLLLLYSFIFMHGLYIIIAINYWIRDVIREYIKKYEEKIQKRKQGIKISRYRVGYAALKDMQLKVNQDNVPFLMVII